MHLGCFSTATTSNEPLEANSMAMFPVPENKSITLMASKSKWLFNTLNRASLAISVVGRTGRPEGTFRSLRLWAPPIIRKSSDLKDCKKNGAECFQIPGCIYRNHCGA